MLWPFVTVLVLSSALDFSHACSSTSIHWSPTALALASGGSATITISKSADDVVTFCAGSTGITVVPPSLGAGVAAGTVTLNANSFTGLATLEVEVSNRLCSSTKEKINVFVDSNTGTAKTSSDCSSNVLDVALGQQGTPTIPNLLVSVRRTACSSPMVLSNQVCLCADGSATSCAWSSRYATSGGYVGASYVGSSGGSTGTWEMWAFPTTAVPSHGMLSRGVCASNDYRALVAGNPIIKFYNAGWSDTPHSIVPNEWHHYAVTFSPGDFRVYVDGTQVYTNSMTLPASSSKFNIGLRGDCSTDPFVGNMMHVRVWNVQRTQAQVAAGMYQLPTATEMATQILFDWRMQDPDTTQFTDSGPGGHSIVNARTVVDAGFGNNFVNPP